MMRGSWTARAVAMTASMGMGSRDMPRFCHIAVPGEALTAGFLCYTFPLAMEAT